MPFRSRLSAIYMVKRLKNVRFHHEGTTTLILGGLALLALNGLTYWLFAPHFITIFYIILALTLLVYGVVVNFFRCPLRTFGSDEVEGLVIAPCDGRVVVIEEVDENQCLKERRLMVSIFMSVTNVHANWFPVEGEIKHIQHHNGNFYKAWLPKASTENERTDTLIATPCGHSVLVRQVAGAVARRIVNYGQEGDTCFIDEHMGFIKFGSRVDLFLPLGTEVHVKLGQVTTGCHTVVATLPAKK